MNPNEFGLYMIILPHEARFCTIFGKIFKENEKSQPLWLTLNDLYFALNMDFQRKKPIFAYKTSYFQFGTLKYIDVLEIYKSIQTFDKDISRQYDGLNGSRYALTVFSLFYNGILTEKDLSEFDDRTREAFLEHRRQWNLEL